MKAKFIYESIEDDKTAQRIKQQILRNREEASRDRRFSGTYIPPEYRDISNETKRIQEKRRKKEQARARIEELSLAKFKPTAEGVEELLNWRDENGNPFDENDYILRTNDGTGELVVYDDSIKLGKEIATQLRNDYAFANDFPFVEVRPITFKNWKRRPFEEKISTLKDGQLRKNKRNTLIDIITKYD
jgi:hypothetical protein